MTFPTFAEFFRICHGTEAYPWQRRLADKVLEERRWPDALDLPTGSGKTSVIDIALYALSVTTSQGEFGVFPRRIILVADRRVLVDQAWKHGRRILERVKVAAELAPVRRALRKLSTEPPHSIRLRGACPTDPLWCRSVDQVQIVASTVDQIGSRLLLRGYGVTPRMRAVEAGLVGQDTLFFLDEAHLAGPFLDTLMHLERLNPVRGIARLHQSVQLSATPTDGKGTRFTLGSGDNHDPVLGPRLAARKTLRWSGDRIQKALANLDSPCILLVANTVQTAIDWFRRICVPASRGRQIAVERETFLITGRMRALDRQSILDSVEKRLGRREPTLVIATQCVEAGVDWDFDAMVSECASWDSLVQRIGRVNRRGQRDSAECIVIGAQRTQEAQGTGGKICPVYGSYEKATSAWLESSSSLQCAPGAMPVAPEQCIRPPKQAPPLITEYLDIWSQNRADGQAYDVSLFLHGENENLSVQVVWRDINIAEDRKFLPALLKALPPSSLEAISVPIRDFRAWIGDREIVRIGTEVTVIGPKDIGRGYTIVVPTSYGGIAPNGTFDGSTSTVRDLSVVAMRDHRNLEYRIYDAPVVNEDEPVEDQVRSWIQADLERSLVKDWKWVDIGSRWLFVSKLSSDSDDDSPTFRGRKTLLESHLHGVVARVESVAKRLGLRQDIVDDLKIAARFHDVGKLDDRFQRLLGREWQSVPLAHSGHSWIERRRRTALSDYPKGERHEALSVELMIRYGLHKGANAPELVEHLVASHHGWSRPFVQSAQGSARINDQLCGIAFNDELAHRDAERAPARFRSVQSRFGWHGLAWLEAILQLSDQQEAAQGTPSHAVPGGWSYDSCRPTGNQSADSAERGLVALNGQVPSDYLAALGVLRSLTLADVEARLRWQGTQPRIATVLSIDDIVDCLIDQREKYSARVWPAELNKLTPEVSEQLLCSSRHPYRSLVVAMISPFGRSDMDFVSGGRSGFATIYKWSQSTQGREFTPESLKATLVGTRTLIKGGKSFRWAPLAAQGARRPQIASNDMRTEPWIEWLSVMGVSALVCIPIGRSGRLETRSTALHNSQGKKLFRWPLWHIPLAWSDIPAALAGTSSSLRNALWCEAPRLTFGTATNRQYGFGAGLPRNT